MTTKKQQTGEEATALGVDVKPMVRLSVPAKPEPERIESMCMRFDHSHGIPTIILDDEHHLRQETDKEWRKRQDSNRSRMRQLYEEATGQGFFKETNQTA